jgi:hypothetical protein
MADKEERKAMIRGLGGKDLLNKLLPVGWNEDHDMLHQLCRALRIRTAEQADIAFNGKHELDASDIMDMIGAKLIDPELESDNVGGIYVNLTGLPVQGMQGAAEQTTGTAPQLVSMENIASALSSMRPGYYNPETMEAAKRNVAERVLASPNQDRKDLMVYAGKTGPTPGRTIPVRIAEEHADPIMRDGGKRPQWVSEFYRALGLACGGQDLVWRTYCVLSIEDLENMRLRVNNARALRQNAEDILLDDLMNFAEYIVIGLLHAQISEGNPWGLNVAPGGAGDHEEVHLKYATLVRLTAGHLKIEEQKIFDSKIGPLMDRLGVDGGNTHLVLCGRWEREVKWRIHLQDHCDLQFVLKQADMLEYGDEYVQDPEWLMANVTVKQLMDASRAAGGRASAGGGGGRWVGAGAKIAGRGRQWTTRGLFLPQVREKLMEWGLIPDGLPIRNGCWIDDTTKIGHSSLYEVRTAPPLPVVCTEITLSYFKV